EDDSWSPAKRPRDIDDVRLDLFESTLRGPHEEREGDHRCRDGGARPGEYDPDAEVVDQEAPDGTLPSKREQEVVPDGGGRQDQGEQHKRREDSAPRGTAAPDPPGH